MLELTNLRTENGKLFDAGKDAKTGRPSYTLEARTGPIHYKEAYKDTDPWLDLDESYCEPGELKGIGKVLVYPRLPNIVTVFQDRCGYQIQSRSNPDHVARVELVSIDGLPVTTWQDSKALKTSVRVHPYRVGIWKDFSASKARATTMRWRVTELGNAAKDSHPFAFRASPEAYNTADLTALDPVSMEQAKVTIETARTRIDDTSWYWDELIPAQAKLVDTDWQVGAGGNDGRVFWNTSAFSFDAASAYGVFIGYINSTLYKGGGFARFENLPIPKSSTIHSAKLSFRCIYTNAYTTVSAKITGHKVGNSTAPSSMADYAARRGTVVGGASDDYITSQVSWSSIGSWSTGSWHDSPSIITPVQEVVHLTTWSNGNAMLLFVDDHLDQSTHSNDRNRSFYVYEENSSYSPKLSITWTEPTRHGPHIYVPNVTWLSKSLIKRREI